MNDNQNNRGKNIFEILEQLFPTDLVVRVLTLFTLGMAGVLVFLGGILYLIIASLACAHDEFDPDPCGAGVDIFSIIVVVVLILIVWGWFKITR